MKIKQVKRILAATMVCTILSGSVALSGITVHATEDKSLNRDGTVSFEAGNGGGPGTIDPVDPPVIVDPYPTPEPGTDGPLSIDFISNFNFGANEISSVDKVYFAKAQKEKIVSTGVYAYRPNYIQLTDNRGTNAGWKLTVKQEGQFTNTAATTVNKVLTGAAIGLAGGWVNTMMDVATDGVSAYNVTLDPSGATSVILKADPTKGAGTWFGIYGPQAGLQNTDSDGKTVADDQGDTTMYNPSVTLSLPGKTPKDAVAYSTSLRWTLENTPN